MAPRQTSLITDAAKQALLDRISALDEAISLHIAQGLDGHDTHTVINQPYLDNGGAIVAPKTLKLGVIIDGVNAYVLIPAFTS